MSPNLRYHPYTLVSSTSSCDPSTLETTIPAAEAGGPGSTVGIDACTE